MKVDKGEYELRLDSHECYNIACDLRQALRHSIETHWFRFPDDWEDKEKERLERLKLFCELSLIPHMYDWAIEEYKKILSKSADTSK